MIRELKLTVNVFFVIHMKNLPQAISSNLIQALSLFHVSGQIVSFLPTLCRKIGESRKCVTTVFPSLFPRMIYKNVKQKFLYVEKHDVFVAFVKERRYLKNPKAN